MHLVNGVKRNICDVINLRLEHEHDLPTSVNCRAISPFCKGFNFLETTHARSFVTINHRKNSEFTVPDLEVIHFFMLKSTEHEISTAQQN